MYYRMTEYNITGEWLFEEDSTFEQCTFFIEDDAKFIFKNVKSISFIHCEFFGKSKCNYFIQTGADMIFDHCTFNDCHRLCQCERNTVFANYCEFKNSMNILNCKNAKNATVKNSRFEKSTNAVCGVKLDYCILYKCKKSIGESNSLSETNAFL